MIPAFVISLKNEKKRREAIDQHLKTLGLDFTFIDAVDGRKMDVLQHPDYNSARRLACHGRELEPGELGCFLSHRQAYEYMIEKDLDYALLLEDDARLNENTLKTLDSLINKDFEFDIVRLLGSPKVARGKHRKILPLFKDFWLVRLGRVIHSGD